MVDLQSWCANLFFAENCMKIKEFRPLGRSWRPPPHGSTNESSVTSHLERVGI